MFIKEITDILTTLTSVCEREDRLVRMYFDTYPSEVKFKERPFVMVNTANLTEKVQAISMNKDGLTVTTGVHEYSVKWEDVQSPYKLKLISYAVCGTL